MMHTHTNLLKATMLVPAQQITCVCVCVVWMCEESLPDTSHQSVTITQWGVVLHLAVLSNDGTPGDNPSRMFESLGRSEVLANP